METTTVKKRSFKNPGYCGVPQCNSYRGEGTPLFRIPKSVRNDSIALRKWSIVLRMGKKFPAHFLICCNHFNSKDILTPASKNIKMRSVLVNGAFPCRNLPTISIKSKRESGRAKRLEERIATIERNRFEIEEEYNAEPQQLIEGLSQERSFNSVGVQCGPENADKGIQINLKPYFSIVSFWDTDKKLNTMTGIPSIEILNTLVEICRDIRPTDKCCMSLKDRILLTMHKLKSNCSFAELAVFHQTCDRTSKLYFADTIQLLAKSTKGLIHWQTRDENQRSLPKCFDSFPNVRTILDCTEIKTATLNCLSCRVCTYSQYKGMHTLKFLIGVSPSGSINYVSKVATGKSSDKAIFNLTDLIGKLEQGDAVMVDKGFMIGDELANAGIEMVRPEFFFHKFSKSDVEKNTKIASARVHVERRISRLKQFRILRDKICVAVIPYIDDIVGVLCGLSNIAPPILSNERF